MAEEEFAHIRLLYNCTSRLFGKDFVMDINTTDQFIKALGDMLNTDPTDRTRTMLTDCLNLTLPPPPPAVFIWWQKLLWVILFAAMLAVATTGNAIVMWIVLAHRRMRTVTNYFLVNLSLSDLLMSLLNCIFNFIFMLDSHWPFGPVYCTVNNFVANVSVAASVFTLVAISVDRYMAIVRPLQHHMSRRKALLALLAIWIASALLALPCLLYSTTRTSRYSNGQSRVVCLMQWPDGAYPTSKSEHMYNLVFLGVTYLGPVVSMAVCYTLMGRKLWGSKSIGEQTQRQLDNIKSKKKVVRMFITVISIFAICWLPYHGYFIYAYHNRSVAMSSYIPHLYLLFYWLAMSNAMVNPIIYYWMNNRFRVYFRQVICFCCCGKANLPAEPQSHQVHMEFIRRSKSYHSQRSAADPPLSVYWRANYPVVHRAHHPTLRQSVSVLTSIQREKNNTWTPDTISSML